jgi:microsomal dipeptidase-like Zn-dependent dipeptidase
MIRIFLLVFTIIVTLMLSSTAQAGICGGEGQIACLWGCNSGLAVRADLLCHAECGGNGEAACGLLPVVTCDQGNTINPNKLTHCIECGGKDQWMCVNLVTMDRPCDYPWLAPELAGVLVYKCREQWYAEEPDCDCDVAVEQQDSRGPVYGIADTHAHQFSNMAFGGALLWGKPYDERGINAALAWGDFTWDFATAWGFPGLPVRTIPNLFLGSPVHFDPGAELASLITEEGGHFFSFDGADSFIEWPRWSSTLHQQMYYRWLERAYRGGLRLMVMLTVNNEVVCGLPIALKRVVGGTLLEPEVNCDDMYTVDQQLEEVKKMERYIDRQNDGVVNGNGWYRIVKSPHEARQAIREGKMAVVLGIEVDGLFGCETPDDCDKDKINSKLNDYYNLGVRHLFPIHLYNNGFGGSAIYNWLWPYVSPLATSNLMPVGDCGFVKNNLLTWGPLEDEDAEYKFEVFAVEPILKIIEAAVDSYTRPNFLDTETGHCNLFGLTSDGRDAVKAMMDKKMVIDVDHLSLLALNEVLWEAQVRDYPLISGHSFLFERPLTEHGKSGPPSEAHRTPLQIEILRDLGGMVAPLNPRKSGSTTRDYVHMYRYIVDKMKKSDDDRFPGIAYASDWGAMFLQTAPRCPEPGDCNVVSAPECKPYDTENCPDKEDTECKKFDKKNYPETGCAGENFPRLEYGTDGFQAVGVDGRFKKQQTGSRVFDFNKDGLAHVGLLPDFIKDLTNVGLTEEELEPLFHSAEAYIRMWEKIHGGPPQITPVIDGTQGHMGQYITDVVVTWEIESVAPVLETDGCDETIIDYDTEGVFLTCWVATDGGEAEETVFIVRDEDFDDDRIPDLKDNCVFTRNRDQANADGDDFGDACDKCPEVPDNQSDIDEDSIGDACDNCVYFSNADQANADGDAKGDICDGCPEDADNDIDEDHFCANNDNCPNIANTRQGDADSDGIGDVCDVCPDNANNNDQDTDGICGADDNCPAVNNPTQADADSDGLGDACDACPNDADNDADNDGTCGNEDECPEDSNKTETGNCGCGISETDTDEDGTPDCNDNCPNDPDKTEPGATACGLAENFIMPGIDRATWLDENCRLTFDEVITGGLCTITAVSDSSPPARFLFLGQAYEISCSTAHDGNIEVCFNYDESAVTGNEKNLTLMHREDAASEWQDVTIRVDTENNTVCGQVASLSEFAVVEPTGKNSGGGCFIATAAYGSFMEPQVMTLRHFRDSYLLTNKLGSKFVLYYYRYSPPIADYITEHDGLRSVVRVGLAPLVGFSWLAMNHGLLTALLPLLLIVTIFVGLFCFCFKRRSV